MKWVFRSLGLALILSACFLVTLPFPASATSCRSDNGDVCICNGPCHATATGCTCGVPKT